MKRSGLLILLGVLAVLALLSVGAAAQEPAEPRSVVDKAVETTTDDPPVTALGGVTWTLILIDGKAVPKNQRIPYLRFDEEKGTAGGNGGCNGFGAKYETDGEKISLTSTLATLRGCSREGETEMRYFGDLYQTNRYEIKERKLYLYRDEKLTLVFQAQKKAPTQPE